MIRNYSNDKIVWTNNWRIFLLCNARFRPRGRLLFPLGNQCTCGLGWPRSTRVLHGILWNRYGWSRVHPLIVLVSFADWLRVSDRSFSAPCAPDRSISVDHHLRDSRVSYRRAAIGYTCTHTCIRACVTRVLIHLVRCIIVIVSRITDR